MKKVKILFATLLALLTFLCIPVLASDETEEHSSLEESVNEDRDRTIFIDNENIYENMDKSYDKGYSPVVEKNVATIVLPLITSESIYQDEIRVAINLGNPSSSPFQFKNYDKTVRLENHSVNSSTATKDSFLVVIDIPLADNHSAGNYPIVISISGQWKDGSSFLQEFPVYVTIESNTDLDQPEPISEQPTEQETIHEEKTIHEEEIPYSPPIDSVPETAEQPVPQAKIILDRCTITPSPTVTGEVFSIAATFKNTSESQSLNNIKITVTSETTDLVPVGADTGSFYVKEIARQESTTINMKFQVMHNAMAGSHKIKFSVEYEGYKATTYSAVEEAIVMISQPVRLEIDEPQLPKEVSAGDTITVSMNVMNLGLNTVHNVRMLVDVQGLLPEKTAFIGNIESGAAQKGDLYVFVKTLDTTGLETIQDDDKYGMTKGKVLLMYEDEYGQEYTKEFEVSTIINPPLIIADMEPEENVKQQNQGQWWISVFIVTGIIVIIVCIRLYKKYKKRLHQHQDDNLDIL